MFSLSTLFVTGIAALSASAMPFSQLTKLLPRDVVHIGLDEHTREFVAYKRDGELYGRYPVDADFNSHMVKRDATCGDLSVEQAQKLPGWESLEQYADDNWGTGSRNVETNPADYLSQPAQVCVTDEVVELSFEGDPTCQSHRTSTEGSLTGTDGKVAIEVDQGFNTDTSYTVSQASTLGIDSKLEVKVGIPEVADVTSSITVSTSVTNTLSSTFDVSYNDVSKVTITMTAPEGKKCTAVSETKTCNMQAKGSIRYLATGWVWFNYDDETEGHYKWAANIDNILTNQDDRSSFADFHGAMSSDTKTAYEGTCE
ncbi:hypothetical protein CYLTODRAFT_420637 [Cylindrobasidium torrendii FP15055 ss-10]|uniref:Uncharacterized protein n=1 Tax=Cylindrobasidium torrendii FP15055 ss-10 TaxID=1314674 RepID=A0A0D7BHJ5_9AGAR|nr:hypothetical protein CYLTODRAFT_420637 [Cylindrobasidium torrendii FP15055 ss-10]